MRKSFERNQQQEVNKATRKIYDSSASDAADPYTGRIVLGYEMQKGGTFGVVFCGAVGVLVEFLL